MFAIVAPADHLHNILVSVIPRLLDLNGLPLEIRILEGIVFHPFVPHHSFTRGLVYIFNLWSEIHNREGFHALGSLTQHVEIQRKLVSVPFFYFL